jgi:DNA-binding MarR family transcriptional regulator
MMTDRGQLTVETFERLLNLSHQVELAMDRMLRRDGLTVKQFQMVAIIGKRFTSPPSITELAEQMGTTHQNVKQLALQLERRGYAEVFRDERDKRVWRVRLTEKNAAYWQEKAPEHMRFMMDLFAALDDRELEGFYDSLVKATAALEDI